MVLGTPIVASDVGGVKDFIIHGENGFVFPFDEPYMLAYYLLKILSDKNLAISLSNNSRQKGLELFNKDTVREKLLSIYREIDETV